MSDWREALAGLPEQPPPEWAEPMLAVLTDRRFTDPEWVFERKLDGERCFAFRSGGRVRLLSRTRHPLEDTYPELADALLAQGCDDFVVDGEVVAFEGDRTSFSRLQRRMHLRDRAQALASGVAVVYHLFDVLHLAGRETAALPLRERKRLLREALSFDDPLRYLPHRDAEGERLYREACRAGWEGLIAKRADAPYRGARSRDWLKLKCHREQGLVIGGYTEPQGSRIGLGALLIGYHDEAGRLRYAGKVGTGYDRATLLDLARRLAAIERPDSPFAAGAPPRKGVHWVEPELVAQVAFAELTGDGKLRHPRYLGLRPDKLPGEVVLERPS